MRKSLLRLISGGVAMIAAVSMVNAQTLTQDWKYIDELPGATDARWGTGFARPLPISSIGTRTARQNWKSEQPAQA